MAYTTDTFIGSGSLNSHLTDTGLAWGAPTGFTGGTAMSIQNGVFVAGGGPSVRAIAPAVALDVPPRDSVSVMSVKRLSGAGRLGPAIRLGNGLVGAWAYYDGTRDLCGLASVGPSGGSVTIAEVATYAKSLANNQSVSIAIWADGTQVWASFDGVTAAVRSMVSTNGLDGLVGDGTADGSSTGLLGTLLNVAAPVARCGQEAEVLAAVHAIVASCGACPRSSSTLSMDPEPFPYAGFPMAMVRAPSGRVDPRLAAGVGRELAGSTLSFTVTVADQASRDRRGDDLYALTGSTGLDQYCRIILDALHLIFPRSANGAYLTQEPIRVVSNVGPARPYRKNPSWRARDIQFEVPLCEALTRADAYYQPGG